MSVSDCKLEFHTEEKGTQFFSAANHFHNWVTTSIANERIACIRIGPKIKTRPMATEMEGRLELPTVCPMYALTESMSDVRVLVSRKNILGRRRRRVRATRVDLQDIFPRGRLKVREKRISDGASIRAVRQAVPVGIASGCKHNRKRDYP